MHPHNKSLRLSSEASEHTLLSTTDFCIDGAKCSEQKMHRLVF